ncbi:MAG TPA: STAS domain-containing protein [Nannocystis exedens]|nr:STAS domain-containing protein [Nannocystis exedens]
MKVSDIDLRKMLVFKPEVGKLLLAEDRMLLFRQESLGVLRAQLREQLGERRSRALLSHFGYGCGKGDYGHLSTQYNWDSEADRAAAGAVFHSWEGLVQAELTALEFDREQKSFLARGIWRNSYEAELHLDLFGPSTGPVCHSLTGYASGYCTAFFGEPVLAIETKCVAMGDEDCEVEIRCAAEWGEEAEPWKQALEEVPDPLLRELEARNAVIQEQELAISELNTPVMEIWEDVLVLPIVGVVDTRRSMEIMNNLLGSIEQTQARCVIIDVTGVEVVDTKTADYLLKVIRAANLLGSRCVLTGLSSAIAQTLVEIGADLSEIRTLRNIKEGLKDCLKHLRSQRQA